VRISGRVQGVVFREFTRRRSAELGVKGFVRNLADGSVEAVFEGTARAVDEAVECAKQGPPLASVTDVCVEEEAPTGEFAEFRIRG
jgi:acylphosphatase